MVLGQAFAGAAMNDQTPVLDRRAQVRHDKAQDDMAKTVARMALTRRRAAVVAARALEHRDPELPIPRTELELMAMIDGMVKHPKRHGMIVLAHERRAVALWHKYRRAVLASRPDASN